MKHVVVVIFFTVLTSIANAFDRYEAEDAVVDENSIEKIADNSASGGFYINMKEGKLSFDVTPSTSGFYTLWASYSQPNDTNGKIQNLAVNGISTGQISFPKIDTFVYIKASSKIKLDAGSNTIEILKSWGWVNIDYIEITPYESTPFTISSALVTPNPSEAAVKIFGFIREQFQKKVISGVMTNTVMQNDGKYTPNTVENQEEVAWIINASGKTPALIGLDFMHAAGVQADNQWHQGYTNATVALAEDIYQKGGIPVYCWHWKDPSHSVDAFYTPSSGNTPNTDFNLKSLFTDLSCKTVNPSSETYNSIIRDLDIVAGYLKKLADNGVAVLWRPLHEASGKWFWWGYSGPAACKGLYRLMFDRFVNYHHLNNLIWVWTTDEAGDALDWYPGDAYVDIIGRDYYYYPREANHGSLVASFEKIKEMYGGRKIIALSENGSVPYPDGMAGDGASWSYFMPWYGDYTMDGWAHDNTAADWKRVLNDEYVITLDKMPGWNTYTSPVRKYRPQQPKGALSMSSKNGFLECTLTGAVESVDLYSLKGVRIARLNQISLPAGLHRFDIRHIVGGAYMVMISTTNVRLRASGIIIK